MMGYLFSIIVPVYNVENYLCECLDSILVQTFTNYEVICIDDASTDNSYNILIDYAKKYSQIKVINLHKNQGLSHARNVGIENANGEYLIFVDSDDMIVPNMLETLWNNVKNEDIDLMYFNMEIRDEGNWAKENKLEVNYKEFNGTYRGRDFFVELYKNKQMKIESVRQLYLKEFIDDNGIRFYEGILHEDILFSFLCAMKAGKVKNINESLYIYRRRDGSISSSISVERMESLMIVISEIYHYWKENIRILEIEEAIEGYLFDLVKIIRRYKKYFPDHKEISIGTKADQFLYNMFFNDSQYEYGYIDITQKQINLVKKYEQVVVFGAGTVGIEVMQFLQENDINNFFFAVSNKKINAENVMNIKIYQIDEIKEIWFTALFIVAVEKSKQQELSNKLQEMGIKNILLPNMK